VQEHPLRVGLSMDVQVDIRDQGGPMLAAATGASAPRLQTTIFDAQEKAADEQVGRIIASNLGKAAKASPARVQ